MNVEKLIKKINKKNFLFHSIEDTNMWIFGDKSGKDWIFTLSEQDSNIEFILGTTREKIVPQIWREITTNIEVTLEIEGIAKELKRRISEINKFDKSKFRKFLDTSTKLHIKIPKSNSYIVAEKEKDNCWKIEIENEKTKRKTKVSNNVTNEEMGIVLKRISKKDMPSQNNKNFANLIRSYINR